MDKTTSSGASVASKAWSRECLPEDSKMLENSMSAQDTEGVSVTTDLNPR